MTSDTTWLSLAMAAAISWGWASQSRVEPSTSANSNVTVPVGNSPLTSSSLQSTSGISARGSISLMLASMWPARPQNISANAQICGQRNIRPLRAQIYALRPMFSRLLAPDSRVRPLDLTDSGSALLVSPGLGADTVGFSER